MYIGEKMNLKIGDKVKMIPRGFRYYSNIDTAFDTHCVGGSMNSEHFTCAVCELFAIHGVGTVKRFNDEGTPYVRFENSLDGIGYFYTHYFDVKDVKKLSLLDKLIFKLKGII
jgi:hypothetical protein